MKRSNKHSLFVFVVLLLASTFAVIMFISTRMTSRQFLADQIAQDIKKLAEIFVAINTSCTILNFDAQQTPINFLNIKKDGFVGSQVGSMDLQYPQKWQGPYLVQHPQVQNIEYMVVKTKQGYFVTPGNGVRLPNGKIIGKDIILDMNADIDTFSHDDHLLAFKGNPLAAVIPVSGQSKTAQVLELVIQDESL